MHRREHTRSGGLRGDFASDNSQASLVTDAGTHRAILRTHDAPFAPSGTEHSCCMNTKRQTWQGNTDALRAPQPDHFWMRTKNTLSQCFFSTQDRVRQQVSPIRQRMHYKPPHSATGAGGSECKATRGNAKNGPRRIRALRANNSSPIILAVKAAHA